MEREIKVSVVIPVYNVERYLKQCLDSVINQTLKEIEIICVNDGSTDNSLNILKQYEKKDDRIIVISKENSGYGNTMNVGMDAANGKYIGIVESDDFIELNMFETLFENAEKYHVQIAKSDHYEFSTKSGTTKKIYRCVCPNEYYKRILNSKLYPEIYTFVMMNWTGIYRTDFIRENNIRHNETPGASFQDNGFWYQTVTLANKIIFINEAFYYYRQDNPNSSINNKKKIYCICDEHKYMSDFLKKHKELGGIYYNKLFEKKFFNYMNSYNRIADEYKMEFLERCKKEFIEDLSNPMIDNNSIDPWVFKQVNRIIDSPKLFWIEDGFVRYSEEYARVHEELMIIRNSKEFKTGLKIKRVLGIR